ncbi:MAG: peptide deformylase [Lachnospiraceae bacterium]|nr:peptide deformylase [Lachnospiraceae bacterium]
MAIRTIRVMGDDILNKTSKPVKEMTDKVRTLINDMLDTMYDAQGVGLAAPQVGILKRIVVIDVSENADNPIILINPEIVKTEGEQTDNEGCLSVPGKAGTVTRPEYVEVKALDENMEPISLCGNGLLARAFAHEIDHLDGKLYVDLVEGELHDVANDEEDE